MIDKIKVAMKAKGYAFFENGDYNLNIIGIRTIGNKVTNVFDDLLTVSYKVNGEWVFKQWAATTDPGTKGVKEFHNAQGVARLVPGQYKGSHAIGLHQGKYEALRQVKPLRCSRSQRTLIRLWLLSKRQRPCTETLSHTHFCYLPTYETHFRNIHR